MIHSASVVYAVCLYISGVISAFVCGLILRRQSSPGALSLLLFLCGCLVWSLSYAMFWASTAPLTKSFWLNVTYFGVVTTPGAMFLFILQFTRRSVVVRYKWWFWLFIIEPVSILLLLWTDPLHGLFFAGMNVVGLTRFFAGGPAFWINVVYSYSLILVGLLLLVSALLRPGSIYRKQALVLLVGCLFPVISNMITFLGLNPDNAFDLTPVAFTASGLFLTYGFLRYGLLDLVPIGRDVLMERMQEGILLLDGQLRIADLNPAARRLLDLPPGGIIGQTIDQALAHLPQLIPLLREELQTPYELDLGREAHQTLEVLGTIVNDHFNGASGKLIILHDVTEAKRGERNLLEANQRLQEQLHQIEELQSDLRDQALRDPLTGVFNRRYLEETLPRELAKASRNDESLSLLMMDIDDFKRLNDLFGHQAGDLALRRLSQLVAVTCRAADVVARVGGDEFVVVLVNTNAKAALARVYEWRDLYSKSEICFNGVAINVTLSSGIAVYPQDASDAPGLFRAADEAMYQAKFEGKNKVRLAGELKDQRLALVPPHDAP